MARMPDNSGKRAFINLPGTRSRQSFESKYDLNRFEIGRANWAKSNPKTMTEASIKVLAFVTSS